MDSFWSRKVSGRRGVIGCLVIAGTIVGCRTVPDPNWRCSRKWKRQLERHS